MPVRLSDLGPAAQQQALDLLGVPERSRKTHSTFHEPPPPTQRQQELQAVRRALSLVAAQLSEQRVEWAVEKLTAEVEKLQKLRKRDKLG